MEITTTRALFMAPAASHMRRVFTATPVVALTKMAAVSQAQSPATATPAKSGYPGQSTIWISRSRHVRCIAAASIDAPRSFSSWS